MYHDYHDEHEHSSSAATLFYNESENFNLALPFIALHPQNPEQKAQLQVIAAVRRFRERQKELARDEDTPEHQQKLVEMKQVTQASDLVCRMYLRRHQWSVPAACEQFFSTIGASTSTSSTPTALEIEYEQWMLAEHRLAAAADEDGELLKGLAVDGPPSNEGGHARE